LGSFKIVALADEDKSRLNTIRSLVADNDIPKGKITERSYLTFKRPAHRISPKYIGDVVGKVAKTNIKKMI
jgi:N-acetylneuraminate synthase